MKNSLSTLLLTLAVIFGCSTAFADDWYLVGSSYNGFSPSGDYLFSPTSNPDVYEFKLGGNLSNGSDGFKIKHGNGGDWTSTLCSTSDKNMTISKGELTTVAYQSDNGGNLLAAPDNMAVQYIRITVPKTNGEYSNDNPPTILLTDEPYGSADVPTPSEKVDLYLVGDMFSQGDSNNFGYDYFGHQLQTYKGDSNLYYVQVDGKLTGSWFKLRDGEKTIEFGGVTISSVNEWCGLETGKPDTNFANLVFSGAACEVSNPRIFVKKVGNAYQIAVGDETFDPAPAPVATWKLVKADGTEVDMLTYTAGTYDGETIYYVELDVAEKGFYFTNGEEAVYAIENAELEATWISGTDIEEGGKYFSTTAAATVYLRPLGLAVAAANRGTSFDPTLNPAGAKEFVFFAGAAGDDLLKVEFEFYLNNGGTEKKTLWDETTGVRNWNGCENFYANTFNASAYSGLKSINLTLKEDTEFYAKNAYVEGQYQTNEGDGSDWSDYIFSQVERDSDTGVIKVWSTYCTPERYKQEVAADHAHLLIKGADVTIDGKSLTWDFPGNNVTAELYMGVGCFHMTARQGSQFKLSWMPIKELCGDKTSTGEGNEDISKRIWTTFDLGLIGAPVDKVNDGDVVNDCYIQVRKPQLYDGYSQSNWCVDTENSSNTDYYLVVDTDEEYRSVTMVTFNPRLQLTNFDVQHEIIDLDENLLDGPLSDYYLKGSTEEGYAYPEKLNKLSGKMTLTPAYYLASEAAKNDIKDNYYVKYHFYNCKCGYQAGGVASSASAHNDDELLSIYPADGLTAGITEPTDFELRNIATYSVPQLMAFGVYTYNRTPDWNHAAQKFRTIPVGVTHNDSENSKINAVNPTLADNLTVLHTYAESEGDMWGLHVIVPFEVEGETDLVYYPGFDAYCGSSTGCEAAHIGMSDVFLPGHYNWPIIGYTPFGADSSDEYNHSVHNWANKVASSKLHNIVMHSVGKDNYAVREAARDTGVTVTAYLAYPFVEYTGSIISKVEDASQSNAPALAARLEANGADPYVIRYSYLSDTKVYKEGENGGTITGIENVQEDASAEAEYFNLQGVKVSAPLSKGVYIVRRGHTVTKELVK